MSNIDSEQIRAQRTAKSYRDFFNQMADESDRGSVIVSSALLDDILCKLLKAKLTPSLEKRDELFDDGASPFATFSARIDLAYRVGIIRPKVRATLHLLRKIRNDFAHVSEPKCFDSDSVKSRLHEIFKLNKDILDALEDDMCDAGFPEFSESRFFEVVGFRRAFEHLMAALAAFLMEIADDFQPLEALE